MSHTLWSKAKSLVVWADELEARHKLPALVRRLIHATIDKPKLVQFPANEGTQRPGWDGILQVATSNPWIPEGKSVWELGTDKNPQIKAESDYTKRTESPGAVECNETVFVFVTPRKWDGKLRWATQKRAEKKWRDVLVWDCDDLEQWLETAPSVDAWLARLLGILPTEVRDFSDYWESLAATSEPALTREVFLAGREKVQEQLLAALESAPTEVSVSALSLAELRDFLSAVMADVTQSDLCSLEARGLIVETPQAWSHLCTSKNRLVLVADDRLALDKRMVAEAVRAGHHVITQHSYVTDRGSGGIRLPRATRADLQSTLEKAGFVEERAHRLAREAGGCISVLVRLASKYAGQANPNWSKPETAPALLPLVLLGSWNDQNPEDRRLVEQFTGDQYPKIEQLIKGWLNQADGPFRFADGIYGFLSREESWQLLSPYFTKDLLQHFDKVAQLVLAEHDPRADMPLGERYLASIYRKLPKYSSALREGVAETIALLGARGAHTPKGEADGSTWRAARLVSQLLGKAASGRWFSLAPQLPLLAEAAPDEFMSILEADLDQPQPACVSLFEKNSDGLFSSSPHPNLMWALEVLAWDSTLLSRVTLALAKLTRLDPGGRINPRPAGVLQDIFRFWLPQTSATVDERLKVLALLFSREPEVAWPLFIALLSTEHDMAVQTSKPRWRDCDTSQKRRITKPDFTRQMATVASYLTRSVGTSPEKWPTLLKHIGVLPPIGRKAVISSLKNLKPDQLAAELRCEIWEQLRELVARHRFFHKAPWALPVTDLDSLTSILKAIAPADPVQRTKWLFTSGTMHAMGDLDTPFEARERDLAEAQKEAISEIFASEGLEGVFRLASGSEAHFAVRIGEHLAATGQLTDYALLLPDRLVSSRDAEKHVALGYAVKRGSIENPKWVESLALEKWSPEAVGVFALSLSFESTTWELLQHRKPEAEPIYWQRARPWPARLSEKELEYAAKALLQNNRPRAAMEMLASAVQNKRTPAWNIVADAVDIASTGSGDAVFVGVDAMSIWELCELMKFLREDVNADRDRLVMLEWRLLPLARHDRFEPTLLHAELTGQGAFFAEIICAIYPAKNQTESPEHARSQAGFSLLESWQEIPGKSADGQIDGAALRRWVETARSICKEKGRLEVCDEKIGEQLSYSPTGSDGTWPCEAVREILESVTTDEVLLGFQIGVMNQRGVTSRALNEGGDQERELAAKYYGYAESAKLTNPRTARILRRIADSFKSDARKHDDDSDARN